MSRLRTLVDDYLFDQQASWAISAMGAAAEFHWVDGDTALETGASAGDGWALRTERGALRIRDCPAARLFARERPSKDGLGWQRSITVCLVRQSAEGACRQTLTHAGPDHHSLLRAEGGATLFDLGLGCSNLDAYVRTADASLVAMLQRLAGEALLGANSAAFERLKAQSPTRVFQSALARIEVYQPIPQRRTPQGPHTHVLPTLLRTGHTHDATLALPQDVLPVLNLYPGPALRDGRLQTASHAKFERWLANHGDAVHKATKARVRQAVARGEEPPPPRSFTSTDAARVAIRQIIAESAGASAREGDLQRRWRANLDGDSE